jgi:DNA polymerase
LPFVGPSGQLLDLALDAAGLSRVEIYITNAVKHFRFLYQDSFRNHRSPSRLHIQACKPWLNAEIAAIKPQALICLGNTAARSLIAPNFVMKDNHGRWLGDNPAILATYHPAAILRSQGMQQDELQRQFFNDLHMAANYIKQAA